jgi:hypothetical protein
LKTQQNLPKTLKKRSREQDFDYYELLPADTHFDEFWQPFGNGENYLGLIGTHLLLPERITS